jgi:hypothetical protein
VGGGVELFGIEGGEVERFGHCDSMMAGLGWRKQKPDGVAVRLG